MRRLYLLFFLIFYTAYGLSMEEAIKRGINYHPYIKQKKSFVRSEKLDYYSTFGSFFPSISFNYTYSKYTDISPSDYYSRVYSFDINWVIYNSGQNIIYNRIKKLIFRSNQMDYKETVLDVVYQIKEAYLQALAKREIWKVRKIQLKAAQKNYQMAKKKLKLGLVTKADYLQAKVRFENVRYSLLSAENDYKKAVANLNSMIGLPLEYETELDINELDGLEKKKIPEFEKLVKIAFSRPVFKQFRTDIKTSKLQSFQSLLTFTPSVFVDYSVSRSYVSYTGGPDSYNTFRIGLSWTIFEGLKRYYTYLSAKEKERYYRYRLEELKRKIKLNLFNLYLDLKTAYKNLEVSKELLKQAEENYKQAVGEYKVGKGDIISLVTAESSLASAHETYINSLLNIGITKSMIERETGIMDILKLEKQ